jgi:copper chaperone CopZ
MKVSGVKKVDVNFDDKTALIEGSSCDPAPMIAELAKAGYQGSVR